MNFINTLFVLLVIASKTLADTTTVPNEVVAADLMKRTNCRPHRTCNYRQILTPHRTQYPSIVLRRGLSFQVTLRLAQPYIKSLHKLRVEFHYGPKPQLNHGTLIYLPVARIDAKDSNSYLSEWRAQIISETTANALSVSIHVPSDAPIGIWRLKVSTKTGEGSTSLRTYTAREPVYLLFNAWSKDDDVFFDDEPARTEYVLNEEGKIYMGTFHRPTSRRWDYDQFHESVLPSVMLLLEKGRLTIEDRKNVVKVSRAVSAVVNSHDEYGLLVGNWSGNYNEGMPPWRWTGSAQILERYLESSGLPVKFAQCWVFAGVTTTALRTLGIPARTISNFGSAHDTDDSLIIDKFVDSYNQPISGVNGDSIWNFHAWSDAWMARHDLPPGYGGWQAIDATPQEMSMDKYQVGPASLLAIKHGRVDFAYDTGFLFSEVNADVVYWKIDGNNWRKMRVLKSEVGKNLLTKKIGKLDHLINNRGSDAQDVVDQYKFAEGSQEERAAVMRAAKAASVSYLFDA